jgi:hypothetical protein
MTAPLPRRGAAPPSFNAEFVALGILHDVPVEVADIIARHEPRRPLYRKHCAQVTIL